VRTITAAELEDWLYGLGDDLGPQTLVNWRSALHAFFGWLLRQKLVDFNPVTAVARPKVVRGAPAIWTPENLNRLLHAAPAELVPTIAIGAFAGLRSAELLRLHWNEVNLDRGLIEVTAKKAKSAQRRLVRIEPNLSQWLAPYANSPTGHVWPFGRRFYYETTARLCRELGLKWPENGLRHSYASYHLAHFQSAEKLALQMGHTTSRLIFDHYREVVTPEDAQRYWGLRP
jgi:integrase